MDQRDLLRMAIDCLERLQIPYLVCGSVASGGYGEPRMTRDIDIVIDLRLGQIAELCEQFPAPEFYVSKEAAREAVRFATQFNIVHLATANKIDFMISQDDVWSKLQFERRRKVRLFGEVDGFAASPEDIILSKMRYYKEGGSEKHLRDISGILCVGSIDVDRVYIAHWAQRLKVPEVWEAVLRRVAQDGE